MPIYVESRDLNAPGGFVAEHQYLVYVPDGEELNYDAWQYIGAFPADGDGSLLTRFGAGDVLFMNAEADWWTMGDFFSVNFDEVEVVANDLGKALLDVEVQDMVAAGYGGSTGSAAYIRHRETVSTLNDVNIAGETGNDLWNFLVATANDISNKYTYKAQDIVGISSVYGPAANSNSFISSILKHVQAEGHPANG